MISYTSLYLKMMKKWKPAYRKSLVTLRQKIADPEKRIVLNNWYNKMNVKNKQLFHRLYARLFQNVPYVINEGDWIIQFSGKTIRSPLRNRTLWLDWDLAVAITGHDPEIKTTYENLIRAGHTKVFFDIGANYGTHSLLFLAQGIKTVSFEPIPFLKKDFEYLCEFNQLQGNMVNVAVGDKSGTATLKIPAGETWNSAISDTGSDTGSENPAFEYIQVPVITVDEFVASSGLYPDLIKIDTEGFELNVLKGALKTIHEKRPLIIFETNNFSERRMLWDFFAEVNYVIQELPVQPGRKNKPFPIEQFLKKGATNYAGVPAS